MLHSIIVNKPALVLFCFALAVLLRAILEKIAQAVYRYQREKRHREIANAIIRGVVQEIRERYQGQDVLLEVQMDRPDPRPTAQEIINRIKVKEEKKS